jgi:hypothetical protein
MTLGAVIRQLVDKVSWSYLWMLSVSNSVNLAKMDITYIKVNRMRHCA